MERRSIRNAPKTYVYDYYAFTNSLREMTSVFNNTLTQLDWDNTEIAINNLFKSTEPNVRDKASFDKIKSLHSLFTFEQLVNMCCIATMVDDISGITYPQLTTDRMLGRITGEYIAEDLPDNTVTLNDLTDYGYGKDDYRHNIPVLPVSEETGLSLINECPVLLLYDDGTEAYAYNVQEIHDHVINGGMLGVDKSEWTAYLRNRDEKIMAESYAEDIFRIKTSQLFKPVGGLTEKQLESITVSRVLLLSDMYNLGITDVTAAVCGSRSRGLEHGLSDINVVVEYRTADGQSLISEEELAALLNERLEELNFDNHKLNIKPINSRQSGNLAEYLAHEEVRLAEKKKVYEKKFDEIRKNSPEQEKRTAKVEGAKSGSAYRRPKSR